VPIDRSKILGEGAIQPSLLEVAPGKLSMLTRSSTGFVLRADSEDNGRSWGDMYETALFNNNSGLDALRLEDGRWVVVHNPVNRNWVCIVLLIHLL
jgi:predicted neuraminidase